MTIGKSILACAVLAAGGLGVGQARAGDWSVDFNIGASSGRQWVDPVYETRCERVWVDPVYETRCEKVWVDAVYETRCERVWVPDRFETRDVRYVDRWGRVTIRCEQVLVEAGHWAEVQKQVLVRDGYWTTVEKRVCVSEGGWQNVEKRVIVRDGYWAPTRGNLDVHVDHGDIYVDRARHSDDDADRFRADRERSRDQQREVRTGRDRGDRYR